MKKIALFKLGGTISAKGKDRTDLKDYRSGLLDGSDFLSALPELDDLADIEVFPVDNISSTQLNYPPLIDLTVCLKWGILGNRAYLPIVAYTIVRGFSYLPSYPRSPCGSSWVFLTLTLVCAVLQLICFCWHLYLYRHVRVNGNTCNQSSQHFSCNLAAHIQNIYA